MRFIASHSINPQPCSNLDTTPVYRLPSVSEASWFPFVPGPWRFENPQDFEATRDKWERELLRRGALPRSRDLQDGPDAEDIEVARPANAGDEQKGDDQRQ